MQAVRWGWCVCVSGGAGKDHGVTEAQQGFGFREAQLEVEVTKCLAKSFSLVLGMHCS